MSRPRLLDFFSGAGGAAMIPEPWGALLLLATVLAGAFLVVFGWER